MRAATNPAAGHESIAGLAGALWRRKFFILVPTLVAFLGSFLTVNLLPVRYSGEARVLLENRETVYSRPDRDNRGTDPAIDPEAVASQVQVVMSRDLALKVIRDLELAKRAEFDPLAEGMGPVKAVLVQLGLVADPRRITAEERVLETYYRRLLVYPQGKSRVISIEFQSEDAALAAAVANRIAEEYLKREEGAKSETSRVTSDWLDKAIEPLMKKVVAAEAKVEAFRSARGLFIGSNNMTITNQQLAELNSQVATARSQQADLQSRAKLIREALRLGRIFETSEVNNNELVRRLLEQRASLKAQIAFDERTLLPGHPRMKELDSQLRDLESQVRSAAERAARAFENDARAAGARVESLQAELNAQKKSATLSNEDEVQLKALEREATVLREQLNSYRTKFLDAAARTGETASPADARVISRALPQNEPAFPKKIPIILLATIATFVITSTLVAAAHLMAMQAAYGDEDATPGEAPAARRRALPEAALEPAPAEAPPGGSAEATPRLGIPFGFGKARARKKDDLPSWPLGANEAPAPSEPPVSAAPAFVDDMLARRAPPIADEIARELSLLGYLGRGKVLIVHGLEQGVRTSFQALRIGRHLARQGSALVIDLAGQPEFYARALGAAEGEDAGVPGLAAYLAGEASPGEIIHRDRGSQLHLLPMGAGQGGAPLVGIEVQDEIAALVELLVESYQLVIIDAGMAGGAGEMAADLADVFALFTRSAEESPALARTAGRLESRRGSPVFIALDEGAAVRAPANDRGFVRSGAA